MKATRTPLFLLGLGLLLATPVVAQDWQDMSASRQRSGEESIDVRVHYAAGEFRVQPASGNTLYRMNMRYDADQFDPISHFDGGALEIGLESERRSLNLNGRNQGRLDLELGRGVSMDLALEFGAVEARMDLGGLSLTSLLLRTGASESRIDVSEPNPVRMRRADFEIGAADFQALRLANLNAREIMVRAGVGSVVLDLSGELRSDLDVEIDIGVGSLELRLPRGAGVKITKESFLTSFDADDMIKRGDAWYSRDWEDAERQITIDVSAAFGGIEVVWLR